jgi:hypothetical protein
MDPDLTAIKEAVEEQVDAEAPNHDSARALADAYVAAHSEAFASHATMTLEQCVAAVDVFRAANMVPDQWRVEAWLLHRFEPQSIGGPVQAVLRVPGQVG